MSFRHTDIESFPIGTEVFSETRSWRRHAFHRWQTNVFSRISGGLSTRVWQQQYFSPLQIRAESGSESVTDVPDVGTVAVLQRLADAARAVPDARHWQFIHDQSARHRIIRTPEGRIFEARNTWQDWVIAAQYCDESGEMKTFRRVWGFPAEAEVDLPETWIHDCAEQLAALKQARTMPAGQYPVIFSGGWNGIWLHEVLGHLLEADVMQHWKPGYVAPGQLVLPEFCHVVDDPTEPNARVSYAFDDEGTTAKPLFLVENGRVSGLMTDRTRAVALKLPMTGHARRASFRDEPFPRTSNIRLHATDGQSGDPEAWCSSIRSGIWVEELGTARLDPHIPQIHLDVALGYRIENGKRTHPIRQAAIRMHPQAFLHAFVTATGAVQTESGRGICEKQGQFLPVSVGQPSVFFRELTVF